MFTHPPPRGFLFAFELLFFYKPSMAIRNIAIIAHVDHGKTTLVDQLLTQSGTLKALEWQDLVMDSNDQERERWITIYAKNTSVKYKWNTINIIDTPWHADFGSEVERVLRMVDSVVLVVDAYEWPMPQTKFVLKKSLELWLRPIVVLNKIDKSTARPDFVVDALFDLFMQLGATDDQATFPVIYASAKQWYAMVQLPRDFATAGMTNADKEQGMEPLFEAILQYAPQAPNNPEKPFRMQIANLAYDDYLGRLGIGRVYEGTAKAGQQVTIIGNDGITQRTGKITRIFTTLWLQRMDAQEAECGDIVTIAWIPSIFVWETIGVGDVTPLPSIGIDEPTLKMEFLVNDSPFAGKEWKYMTTRNLDERLKKELETNVWLKLEIEEGHFLVSWRWELHLSVLVETMRREGREIQVGPPQVIFKHDEQGKKLEPIEQLIIHVEDNLAGTIIQNIANRKGTLQSMFSENGLTTIEFLIPTRGLLWFSGEFVLLTRWQGLCYSSFSHYGEYAGEIEKRTVWCMIAAKSGITMAYSIFKLQDRGPIFVEPAQPIYEWMIVGEHSKWGDLVINLTVNKQLTNVRNSGNDEAMRLEPIVHFTLEDALGYIGPDELVEITPKTIRMRKKYLTDSDRTNARKAGKA